MDRTFIILNYLVFFLPISFADNKPHKINRDTSATCGQPFRCGNITNITYPFWKLDSPSAQEDSSRQLLCGHPSFGLLCRDVPVITISRLSYRVLKIDFFRYTLKVARQDIWNDTCRPNLFNTTLNDTHFKIPPDSTYKNVTLYYNCTGNSATLPNQFTCGSSETTTNLFHAGGGVSGAELSCNRQIMVPVDDSSALLRKRKSPTASGLRDALAGGFTMQWSADDAECMNCLRLWSGACAYNNNFGTFYCRRPILYPRLDGDGPPKAIPPTGSPSPASARNIGGDYATNISSTSKLHSWLSHQTSTIKFDLALILGSISSTLAFILASRWCCKARRFPRGRRNPTVEKFLLQHGSLAPKRYKYLEIKKITKSFSNKLGQGGYGSVYKGTLPDGCTVAVKLLINTDSNDEEFINEVASISRTSHVNIVSLLGFCYERNKRALVYEFMPNNSLDKFIKCTDTSLDMDKLYNVAVGVAKGLEYLHKGCNTRIIHFDIKPQNILLDEGFCPKISDFGLAKLCKKKQSILSVLGTRGTAGYIAPEVFYRNFGKVSHKSDVYSYGIMILEMAGARKFVEAETIQSCENYFPDKIYEQTILGHVMKIVNFNESMVEQEDDMARKMFLVGFWCIQTTPSDRPSMSKVVEMLEGNLESIQVPPKPFLFNPKLMRQELSPSLSVQVGTQNSTEY